MIKMSLKQARLANFRLGNLDKETMPFPIPKGNFLAFLFLFLFIYYYYFWPQLTVLLIIKLATFP